MSDDAPRPVGPGHAPEGPSDAGEEAHAAEVVAAEATAGDAPDESVAGDASDGDAPVASRGTPPPAARTDGDDELLRLIDRLAALLDRSDLTELEVGAGETGLVLRKPAALAPVAAAVATAPPPEVAPGPAGAPGGDGTAAGDGPPARPSVKAPLTGIFYASPAPGSAPYVSAGGEVAVGQVIGLIEAMKLFNEIKSDLAGRVVRVVPDSGTLVKAKQPLIEVEPL
jgi:acetyl-CoA carboxylase biotin carboxyl carrier protein